MQLKYCSGFILLNFAEWYCYNKKKKMNLQNIRYNPLEYLDVMTYDIALYFDWMYQSKIIWMLVSEKNMTLIYKIV